MSSDQQGWVLSRHGYQYFKFGKHAILLQWPDEVGSDLLHRIINVKRHIQKEEIPGIIEVSTGYKSLTIFYKPDIIQASQVLDFMESTDFHQYDISKISDPVIIDVVYNDAHALDLAFVAEHLDLSVQEVINIHTAPVYDLYFIGFLPGFMYLSGLDKRLFIPRKEVPRIRVPQGSVAIAGGQTGIYPFESPGGWHIIGQTNIELFNPFKDPPCPYPPGTKIKFRRIHP